HREEDHRQPVRPEEGVRGVRAKVPVELDVGQQPVLRVGGAIKGQAELVPDPAVRARLSSATPSPLPMMRVRIPRVRSAAASTSPVGPAPTTSTWQSWRDPVVPRVVAIPFMPQLWAGRRRLPSEELRSGLLIFR